MNKLQIERAFEESHIRRGRLATSPMFYVSTDGWRWSFTRRKDAQRFIDNGGVCPEHAANAFRCSHCLGWRHAMVEKAEKR